jgi:hypothetical protein
MDSKTSGISAQVDRRGAEFPFFFDCVMPFASGENCRRDFGIDKSDYSCGEHDDGKRDLRKKIPAKEAAGTHHMMELRKAFRPRRRTAKATIASTAGLRP